MAIVAPLFGLAPRKENGDRPHRDLKREHPVMRLDAAENRPDMTASVLITAEPREAKQIARFFHLATPFPKSASHLRPCLPGKDGWHALCKGSWTFGTGAKSSAEQTPKKHDKRPRTCR